RILCFEITYGSTGKSYRVFTDGTEKAGRGYITFNNLYYGETHDYTRFSGDIFTAHEKYGIFPVKKIPAPKAKYLLQKCPNDKIIRKLKPAEVGRTDGGIIYDAGENISGFVSFVSAGEDVFIKHAENIKNGSLDFTSAGGEGQISETAYFSAKKGTSVHPFFCWSGFRYFEVKGRAEQIEVNVVHADIAVTSKFFCGNETLNRLYDIYIRTQLNNMHGGIPSDCPHRERLGYTGDGQLVCESAMLLTNARGFFEKWTRDIADCQDIVTGHVQHTAPFCGGGGGPGGWGGAMVLVPYYHYKLFGDKAFVKKYFRNGLKYIESMERFLDGGLVVREMPGGWCLGDWCTPGKVLLPESFVNTYFYIKCMRALEYLGRETDEYVDFAERIEKSLSAITEKYYDSENNTYCGGVQGADAFALSLGIGNKAMKDALIERYSLSGKPDTGIFGTDVLFAYLAENGEADLLFKLFTATEYPSFGYMLKNGATTLWEDWDGKTSHDHPMFGACVKQIFYGILGVKLYPSENKVVLAPRYVEGMGTAEFSLSVCGGNFSAKYRYSGGKVKITVKERIGVTVMIE
ncbi:MAG: family 78 glycoside hydrolase catalytic domain, partial [Clostridia bacterium]|nr:family 78 glycoside hydrolase catalytic domain [Clostridia bacterium]